MRNLDIEFERVNLSPAVFKKLLKLKKQNQNWLKKQLKNLDKFDEQSKKANRKVR